MIKLNSKIIIISLTIFCFISLFLHLIKIDFPFLNSDEAAFGYNTYSILKTGKDEYGALLPTRFKSFGEYKLPVMGYLSLPFIATMGLNEISTRMVVYLIGIFSPVLFYFLAKELTGRKDVGLVAAFLSALSPWIQIISRHAHEAVVAYLFISLALIFFYKFSKNFQIKNLSIFSVFLTLALFSHHITKPFVVLFTIWFGIILFQKKVTKITSQYAMIFLVPLIIFAVTEAMHPTTRISNLLFYSTSGFTASIEELRKEDNNRLLHNKVTKAVTQLTQQYLSYFSPEFLVTNGDKNERFGYKGISPISPIEYLFLLIGLYYLFKNKAETRYILLGLLLIAPLSASISWQEYSLTRALYMIVPILLITAYGVTNILEDLKRNQRLVAGILALGVYSFFTFFTWDFYFNHYTKKPQAVSAWQGGYKELGSYLKQNYNNFDNFYITRKLGQPYIFTLFYLQYPPENYQKQAQLSAPDEYGFGQVERFDKFVFNFDEPTKNKTAFIGYPEDFSGTGISDKDVQKITIEGKEVFWIYERE